MQTVPLDLMLWLSLAALGLGVLALVPIWWRGRARLPIDETDVTQRNIAGSLLTGGTMGVLGTGLTAASRAMSFGGFMVLCGVGFAIILAIALRVDAARRHR